MVKRCVAEDDQLKIALDKKEVTESKAEIKKIWQELLATKNEA
jgi:hypothetical protein